jgi:hypothetical protein
MNQYYSYFVVSYGPYRRINFRFGIAPPIRFSALPEPSPRRVRHGPRIRSAPRRQERRACAASGERGLRGLAARKAASCPGRGAAPSWRCSTEPGPHGPQHNQRECGARISGAPRREEPARCAASREHSNRAARPSGNGCPAPRTEYRRPCRCRRHRRRPQPRGAAGRWRGRWSQNRRPDHRTRNCRRHCRRRCGLRAWSASS